MGKKNKQRVGVRKRKTKETAIDLRLKLDGTPGLTGKTSIPFMDHMLDLLSAHGGFSLAVRAKGDTQVDDHHLVEDLGICLGEALKNALGDKRGIQRYGQALIPMDEVVVQVAVDLCGRVRTRPGAIRSGKINNFDVDLIVEFLEAFAQNGKFTLYVNILEGADTGNLHHVVEAIFKAIGRALRQAVALDPRVKGVPSTKGLL